MKDLLLVALLITWPLLFAVCLGQWLRINEMHADLSRAQTDAEQARNALRDCDAARLRIVYLETRLRQMTFDALARSVNMIVVRPN